MPDTHRKEKVLITGIAGFVGFNLAYAMLKDDHFDITGLDNINTYYDIQLKFDRLTELGLDSHQFEKAKLISSNKFKNLDFVQLDIEDGLELANLFENKKFDLVVHLAAQAGVRYSMQNPHVYIGSNVTGFVNVLECCKTFSIRHLIFASSSSVYGNSKHVPFREDQSMEMPVSLYAATKRANELMAYTYHHLYKLPVTGLRFFTVYGPWGRPDMSPMLFAHAIKNGKPIKVFNHGKMRRDFTYIDDIVDGIIKVIEKGSNAYEIFNIGNSRPIDLMEFIGLMEKEMGQEAEKEMLPMQPGDVYETYADTSALTQKTGYKPSTNLPDGIKKFLDWFKNYYS